MKKWLKIVLIIVAVLAVIAVGGLFLFRSGALIRPSQKQLSEMIEVPQQDNLLWQEQREADILADYAQGSYTFEAPYIFVDPYEMNPLSALVIFEISAPAGISVTVEGKDGESTFTYTKTNCQTRCEVPVIGLYAGTANTVMLEDASGNQSELSIETEPLPVDFQHYELVTSQPDKMEPGITLFTACFEHSYTALLDGNGDVRGYLSQQYIAHGTSMNILENGHILATGDEYRLIPYNMMTVLEFNWLGKIFTEYQVPNGVHHDLREMSDGNFLAVSNNADMFNTGTREDVVVIIDRTSGVVIRQIDFREILDDTREMYHHFDPPIKNGPNRDWMHMNAALYDEDHNAFIVSSPTQSQVVSIDADTEAINWILGPHEHYEGSSSFMQEFLLEPIGENFEWQWAQHQPMILPDFDNNPNTIDLLLFDNGQTKSSEQATAVLPADNYSRGVQFRINTVDMTVEQIWQYGKECGTLCYATFLGDANYHPQTGNRMMTFGGQLRIDGQPADEIIAGVFGQGQTISRVIEVTEAGEVVYEVSVTPGENDSSGETYQAKRMPLYVDSAYDYTLTEVTPLRLGHTTLDGFSLETTAPNLFLKRIGVDINQIYVKQERLIVDGYIGYPDSLPTIGRAYIALTSPNETFSFETRPGLNGRFFANIDLSQLPAGEYQISVFGGVSNATDVLQADLTTGHIASGYKVTVGGEE